MKKIAVKLMISLLLLLTFMVSNTHIVHAEVSSEDFEEVACSCGKGTYQMVYQEPITSWNYDHEEKCFLRVFGTDMISTAKTITKFRCNACGQKKQIITTEIRYFCHGYDF